MLFESWMGLGRVALASIVAYAALIVVLRLSGKRSLSKLNAFDLVVTVALGSTLATVLMSKDVALAEGALAFAMLAALQFLVARASLRWPLFERLVRSDPAMLVRDGCYLDETIRAERVTRAEVDQAVRKSGVGRIADVAAVVLETDGSFSVIRCDESDAELSALRSVRTGGGTTSAKSRETARKA